MSEGFPCHSAWKAFFTESAQLTASDGAANDFFGISVAISGDFAIVGAPDQDTGGNSDQSKAYLFIQNYS